jgi:hypothetical protein
MNDTIDDLDGTHEETFTYDVSDEELEALAANAVMRMWTRTTTTCGGPVPGPTCGPCIDEDAPLEAGGARG